jgi:hypothetical protein
MALLLPSAIALLAGIAAYFARSPAEALTVGIVVYFVLQIGLALVAIAMRWRAGQTPNLNLQPSSGPSTQVRVAVTNQGRDAQLRVTGRLVGRKNDPNALRRTAFSLAWLANRQPALVVQRGQTENVLVAEFEILEQPGVIERMGEMRVMEFTADGPAAVDTARWSFFQPYQPLLPEIHVELTFHAQGYANAIVRSFMLRPAARFGPLELVPLGASTAVALTPLATAAALSRTRAIPSAMPPMIARPRGLGEPTSADIEIAIREHEWNRNPQGRMILRTKLRIHNTNQGAARTIRQYWLNCPGYPQVNAGPVSLQGPGRSQEVGPVQPGETLEGTIFTELPNAGSAGPLYYQLAFEDDLGRVTQATGPED